MTEKWAQECAAYEEGGAAEYLKAALEYERLYKDGWSERDISEAVTDAGFRIANSTIHRRLAAVSAARSLRLRSNTKAFLEAFASAYAAENASGRGQGTALDPETALRVYIEGVVGEFERHFGEYLPDLDEEEIDNIRRLRSYCDAVLNGRPILTVVKAG